MNYELHVVKGRSATTALKLSDGETSVGRHNACTIRIKSSQVSRRHCEISQKNGKLIVRDLNSSNGTIVNGKRIKEISILQDGDELTIGGVVLRIVGVREGGAASGPTAAKSPVKPSDTAELDAMPDEDGVEFEIDLDADQDDLGFNETVPLDDESDAPAPPPNAAGGRAGAAPGNAAPSKPKADPKPVPSTPPARTPADDAIDEFLLDLKLDDD
ncbi:MAG: hypothetical protein ABS79_03525 [Planctomycetes bacterium SCN 63-9]|nr:MAG: hypothetical protein ABS79_03525 [Planctomycetes bacterium SCN 63-9]